MEMEYFVPPDDGAQWYEYWCQERFRWYIDLGIPEDQLRLRPHDPEELSHYSAGTSDVEFLYPWGWGELEGIANRTDYDLTQHAKFSGQDLTYFDQETRPPVPAVRDRAGGRRRPRHARVPARRVRRGRSADNGKGGTEKRDGAAPRPPPGPDQGRGAARCRRTRGSCRWPTRSAALLRPHFMIDVDVAGSIGRRYRRQDEVGTPLCVTSTSTRSTIEAVTIRDRDSMTQERVPIDGLLDELQEPPAKHERQLLRGARGRARGIARRDPRRAPPAGLATSRPHARRRASPTSQLQANRDEVAQRPRRVERAVRPVPAPALRRRSSTRRPTATSSWSTTTTPDRGRAPSSS